MGIIPERSLLWQADPIATMSQSESAAEAIVSGDLGDLLDESRSVSMYSASEGSKSSSSSSQRASDSRRKSKKRKVEEELATLQPRSKRLRNSYNDQYRVLYNDAVNEIASQDFPKDEMLSASQIGVTFWSSEEKAVLFHSLAKRGRHDFKVIANDVGSKSGSEVQLYLDLLQKAAVDQHIHEPLKKILRPFELNVAMELSDKCCVALDSAAEALAILQQKEEERLEKSKHSDYPILTCRAAKSVDRRLRAGEDGKAEVSKATPPAILLDLKKFLTLSKRFFMNSSDPDKNWRCFTEKRQSPMIMYTAFSDFHTLTISITRRLIQSCLFIAMSRLRATIAPGHYIPRRHVKRRDVVAALNVLGMKADATDVWARMARKCGIRVYENVRRRQVSGKRYSYDEIEMLLGHGINQDRGRSRAVSMDASDRSVPSEDETNWPSSENVSSDPISSDYPLIDEGISSESSDETNLPRPPYTRSDKSTQHQERYEQAHDAYAEALDQQASRKEEQRLWEMLGEDPGDKMNANDIRLPEIPYAQRKGREDLVDWKVWVDYAGEWETMQSPVQESCFIANRRLGRKGVPDAGLTESDSIEEWPGREQSADGGSDSEDSLRGKSHGRSRSSSIDGQQRD